MTRAGVLLLSILGGCQAAAVPPVAPSGSVGVGGTPLLAHLAGSVMEDGTVALVLPPRDPGRPRRVVLAAHSTASPGRLLAVLADVERYPSTVEQVASVTVRERSPGSVTFDVELELPFQNLTYGLRYEFRAGPQVDVLGLDGALAGGRWCWEVVAQEEGSLIVYTSESELGDEVGLVIGTLLDFHPDLQEGMAFAQGLRFLRSIVAAAEGP